MLIYAWNYQPHCSKFRDDLDTVPKSVLCMEPNFVLCDLALEVFQIPEPSPAPAFGSGINNSIVGHS